MSNEQRAAEVARELDAALAPFVWSQGDVDAVAAAVMPIVDAAEARGRADVEAKVRELADEYERRAERAITRHARRINSVIVGRLRALVATGTDRDEGR